VNLKNKHILITAGPTWVPIDKVRVISNIATGETGILLAEAFKNLGARVTLLLGPTDACCLDKKIRLVRFKFFEELKSSIIKELSFSRYDIVIHSAAVSDYKPLKVYSQKIKSGIKNWQINLVPTEKLIDLIRRFNPSLFLVGFKFDPETQKEILIKRAKNLKENTGLDLVVANTVYKNQYKAFIINRKKVYGPLKNKNSLAEKLISLMGENL
jgi:phosphopantothenoylcysteine decarboxylase/phosphopantothenate--cysteine ligase